LRNSNEIQVTITGDEIRVTKTLLAESGDWRKNAFPVTVTRHPYLVTLTSSP